MSYMTTVRSQS